jgi:ferric enterobactin receptor
MRCVFSLLNHRFKIAKLLFIFGCVLLSAIAYGQTSPKLTGKIQDAESKTPLPFSSIRLYVTSDSTFKSGALSDENGIFSIDFKPGEHYALIEFVGFKSKKIDLSKYKGTTDLGIIYLNAVSKALQEVVVQAEKSSLELALDKRIFHVGKDLSNAGGTASDILNNVPSVTVDVEGNVNLRGSSVRILVDGKPSGLVSSKGGSGLQQLQASAIDRIEVITNPSARYEAEGLGGVINRAKTRLQRFIRRNHRITG